MTKTDVILIRNANQFDFGGAEKYQILLAQELIKNGFSATIVSDHQKLLESADQNNLLAVKAPWLKFQNFSGWRIILTPLYFLWQIRLYFFYLSLFKKLQPQIVHIHSRDDFIAGTLAAHKLKIKVFWTDHADFKHIFQNVTTRFKNPIGKKILKISAKVNQIILISQSEKTAIGKHLPKNYIFWNKTTIIHNGVNDVVQKTTKTDAGSIFTFATSSRLVKDKGIAETISAFNKLCAKSPNCQLLIIGNGPDAEFFKSVVQNNARIKFLGYLENPFRELQEVDCFLMPTYHEGLSLSLIEACMLGLPIITTKVGGNPEIIESNYNGLLIPPRDSQALVTAMLTILNNPALAQKLARHARITFEQKFDFAKIVKQQILPLYFPKNDKI